MTLVVDGAGTGDWQLAGHRDSCCGHGAGSGSS